MISDADNMLGHKNNHFQKSQTKFKYNGTDILEAQTHHMLDRPDTPVKLQCFPKVAPVADHFNRVADQLRHFARPNDPQNLNWWGRNLSEPDRGAHCKHVPYISIMIMCTDMQRDHMHA